MGNRKNLRKLTATPDLTEGEWVRELEYIDGQLSHVLDVFNFLEELSRLSKESETALAAFNTTPLFWLVFRDCLQESLFMGLGRLCDPSSDAVNVERVLLGAMAHPEFFSAEALERRVSARGLTESLVNHLTGEAWVPDGGAALRFLRDEVSGHLRRIETIYRPIRDRFYAHRLTVLNNRQMFGETNRAELGEILDTLRQMVAGLRFLYENGAKPRVDVRGIKALDLDTRRSLRDVVSAVAGHEI